MRPAPIAAPPHYAQHPSPLHLVRILSVAAVGILEPSKVSKRIDIHLVNVIVGAGAFAPPLMGAATATECSSTP